MCLARNEIRRLARQEQRRPDEIVDFGEAPELDAADDTFGAVRPRRHRAAGEIGHGRGRRQRIDAHAVAPPFGGEGVGHMGNAGLGGAVGHFAGVAGRSPGRAEVDNLAVAALDHRPANLLTGKERALEVGVNQPVPIIFIDLLNQLGKAEASVVDEDQRHGAVGRQLGRRVAEAFEIGDPGHIGDQDVGVTTLVRDQPGETLESVLATSRQQQPGAGAGKGPGDAPANALAGAGDDGESPVEAKGGDSARLLGATRHRRLGLSGSDRSSRRADAGR